MARPAGHDAGGTRPVEAADLSDPQRHNTLTRLVILRESTAGGWPGPAKWNSSITRFVRGESAASPIPRRLHRALWTAARAAPAGPRRGAQGLNRAGHDMGIWNERQPFSGESHRSHFATHRASRSCSADAFPKASAAGTMPAASRCLCVTEKLSRNHSIPATSPPASSDLLLHYRGCLLVISTRCTGPRAVERLAENPPDTALLVAYERAFLFSLLRWMAKFSLSRTRFRGGQLASKRVGRRCNCT
jgi:hypothetical protein